MNRVYNQANTTLTIDGITMQDFGEGTAITVTLDGGEVQKTQGTDGAGINIATNQGGTIKFTLRETSRSIAFLVALRLKQERGGDGCTVVVRTGGDAVYAMTDGYISRPGELSTGDKTQGTMEFTITSASDALSNL